MSATPIQYSSTDASEPVLTGQSGSIISLLRAILVSGYGAKAAAGWTEPFSAASNVAVFRNSSIFGTGMHLWVNDNNLASGKTAAVRGFLSMTDLNTGTDSFPTAAQQSPGLYVRKSETADSTARAWWALACRKWIYLFIDSNATGPAIWFWGDIKKANPADSWNCVISGGITLDPNTSMNRMLFQSVSYTNAPNGSSTGMYTCRGVTGLSNSSDPAVVWPSNAVSSRIGATTQDNYYPSAFGGGLMFEPLIIGSTSPTAKMPVYRGLLPNAYNSLHFASNPQISNNTVFSNVPGIGSMICKWYRAAANSLDGSLLFDLTSEG